MTTATAYDALNRVTSVTDARGGVTSFAYDPNGNLVSLTDTRGNTTSYTYNSMDRVATRTDPLGHSESFTYDLNGNLSQHTDRKGQVATATYDALNRRTGAAYADATVSYTVDAVGRLTQATDSIGGTITNTYDILDRLASQVTALGTMSYQYDVLGRRTQMTVPNQSPVTYAYDAASRPTSITQGASAVQFAYDASNRRTVLTLPNGVSTQYVYNTASQLTALTYQLGATMLGDLQYTYDAAGNRVQIGGSWARTGLPQAVTAATYNVNNQQLTFGSQNLTYDLNGNLTGDGTNTYTWDARNRLAAIAGSLPASFVYDAAARRGRKIINGVATDFVYDALNPVQEQSGSTAMNLLTGLGVDEYFSRGDATSAAFFLADPLRSTVALADNAGGVTTEYTYDPFGVTSVSGIATVNPFDFTARESDLIGLKYYRARYYQPLRQRFISEDPIGLHGGPNLYAYVVNRPTWGIDPLGFDVTISMYQCCMGLSHLGIGINVSPLNTVGFYPATPHTPFSLGVVLPDWLRNQPGGLVDSITLVTTPEQDRAIQEFINSRTAEPGYYILSGRHCGTFVQDALRAGGIDPFEPVASPLSVFMTLKAMKEAAVDFSVGVTRPVISTPR
jgi:RHS repeat-associated protein